ncbi:hypothetical protein [Rhodothermus marinus]|uniref:hypothetical protein n=1 Tax=Rhodothermus marinus TaxID=29549 RepID=UPI000AC108B5|nr:hypothetical protein [Rhodothermus marinus]
MKRLKQLLLILGGGILLGWGSLPRAYAQQARIKIDPDRVIDQVDPLIYGSFVEHLGRCVYGGIYEPGSPLADEDGLRQDVLQAVRELGVTILRYPGGNFVSNYHWLDGVGPERKPRLDLAWHVLEPNTFGTNEFMKFIRKVGAEPYFTVNMGTGTIEEAQWWVEYTNVKEGPYYAELRKQHGFPEPYGIKFWSLGNEMDGFWQLGHLNAEDYAKKSPGSRQVDEGHRSLDSADCRWFVRLSSGRRPAVLEPRRAGRTEGLYRLHRPAHVRRQSRRQLL